MLTGQFWLGNSRLNTGFALVPDPSQDVAAVDQILAILGKYFQGDGGVVFATLEGAHVTNGVDIAGTEREVKVCVPAFVVVHVNVFETHSESGKKIIRGV